MENLAVSTLAEEKIWLEKPLYELAERRYYEKKAMDQKMVSDYYY
jgi:hypothetical protein